MSFGTLPLLVSLLAVQAQSPKPSQPSATSATLVASTPLPGQPNLLVSGIPPVPSGLERRVHPYLESRSALLLDVADDGKQVLIATRFADVNQLHIVESPMGARTQLTFTPEPIAEAQFLPGTLETLIYRQDVGGGEFFQLYRLDRSTGRSELLTDGKSRHESFKISQDGQWLAYSGTGRNGKDTDVYVAPASNPRQARRVTEAEGAWLPVDFSRDGSKLLVQQVRSVADVDLHVVDLKTNALRQLTPKEGMGGVADALFTPDGQGVYLLTDRYSDFSELYRLELAKAPDTGVPLSLTRSIPWNVEKLVLSPDGRQLALSVNEDGASRIYLVNTRTQALEPVSLPQGVLTELKFPHRRSDTLFFSLTTARSPADVWRLDLRTKKTERWTRSEVGGLNTGAFAEPERVRYASTAGVQVPAYLYLPVGRSGKVPVVTVFHGGPEGQSRPTFNPFVQFLVTELKMAVLLPNVRGSEGYGKAYRAMDDGVKREQSLADIGATLDFIASHPRLDASRVGVYGGSYGGYMVLATAAFFPERIQAVVDVVGISSLPSFLQNTQAYRRDLRRAEYGDERDPEVRKVQERISPLGAVERIRAALYVQQGKNDPRVPQSEAEQVVKAVRARGADVWYMLALDEGHGFNKKPNKDYALTTAFMFLEKHLSPEPSAPPEPK
ncbi:alpha/beta fold hydrolase [Stigmatella sp. ncwal1]|uniref:Alpha/beta fold hydrolase n=1 Tax=Stigmatella ashevillensis TaxID=2995309 RepID=A0ABT5DLD9_9BACT|nr:alpha/beta fold hydrolase [Stigmatella ashevillena]MDC0713177.1 alpha/beta fold hydrolase [Stigmatella ashevillena]